MEKIILLGWTLTSFSFMYSQIGINTSEPKATLEVAAKNAKGISSDVDGFVLPAVDRQRAQAMMNVAASTLIYIDDVSTGTQTGKAVYINEEGFYYFKNDVWNKFSSPAADQKMFGLIPKTATQTGVAVNSDITWKIISGQNTTGFSVAGSVIKLPPNKTFSIQGYVAWLRESPVAAANAWLKYRFVDEANNANIGFVNIYGFAEASTEQYLDGGTNPALLLVKTGPDQVAIKLRIQGKGGDAGSTYNISSGIGNTGTTYVIIQEL